MTKEGGTEQHNLFQIGLLCFVPLYVPKNSPLLSSVFHRMNLKGPQMPKLKDEVKAEYMSDLVGEYYRMENYHVCFPVM